MEPWDFCEKWLEGIEPDQWGYRNACIEEIGKITGLSYSAINNWGSKLTGRPNYVAKILAKEDQVRRLRQGLKKIQQDFADIQKILDEKEM